MYIADICVCVCVFVRVCVVYVCVRVCVCVSITLDFAPHVCVYKKEREIACVSFLFVCVCERECSSILILHLICTHRHKCIHSRAQHTHSIFFTLSHTHINTRTCQHTTHACTHEDALTHTRTRTHTNTHMHTHTYTLTHSHTRTQIKHTKHTRTHAHTHTHTHTLTHKHTNTHTYRVCFSNKKPNSCKSCVHVYALQDCSQTCTHPCQRHGNSPGAEILGYHVILVHMLFFATFPCTVLPAPMSCESERAREEREGVRA